VRGYLDPDPDEPDASDNPTGYCLGQVLGVLALIVLIFIVIFMGSWIYYATGSVH